MSYKLSKRHTLMEKYVALMQRIRNQEARVEVQEAKLHGLVCRTEDQRKRVLAAKKEQRKLLKQSFAMHAGFLPKEVV